MIQMLLLNEKLAEVFQILYVSSTLWLPLLIGFAFWKYWLLYIRTKYISEQSHVVLEIKIPKKIERSPVAMEILLGVFSQTRGESTFIDRYISGKVRSWFSLEIVSIEGQVRFFIWTPSVWKNVIETQIYAQYPEVEVHEAEDYTSAVPLDLREYEIWGCNFDLTKPDHYPIKTYIDYQMDKESDETFKIDPITAFIEFLGSVGKGQQVWFQFIIRAHKKEKHKAGTYFKKVDWSDQAKADINRIMKRDKPKKEGVIDFSSMNLTKGEKETVDAIERNISKLPFDAGIRGVYIAEKNYFNPINISALIGSFKQYNSVSLNGFKPSGGLTVFNYPWQGFIKSKKENAKKRIFNAYKNRGYFHSPFKTKHFVLSSEELATIFHFPSSVVSTPTFSRLPSKKSDAPSNLPTQS